MVRYLHKNRFVVVEETAELLAATIVLSQPVSAAGRGSQEILTERGFMASEADIDARRRAGVVFHHQYEFNMNFPVLTAMHQRKTLPRVVGRV
jgi:hypothetical protein